MVLLLSKLPSSSNLLSLGLPVFFIFAILGLFIFATKISVKGSHILQNLANLFNLLRETSFTLSYKSSGRCCQHSVH